LVWLGPTERFQLFRAQQPREAEKTIFLNLLCASADTRVSTMTKTLILVLVLGAMLAVAHAAEGDKPYAEPANKKTYDKKHEDYGKKHEDYGKKHEDYGKKYEDYGKKYEDYPKHEYPKIDAPYHEAPYSGPAPYYGEYDYERKVHTFNIYPGTATSCNSDSITCGDSPFGMT
jgi:hypothetical protein